MLWSSATACDFDKVPLALQQLIKSVVRLLTLPLCLMVLAAAVDCEGGTNDAAPREWRLAWTDENGDDAPDSTSSVTAYNDLAAHARLSIVLFEDRCEIALITCSPVGSASVSASVESRGPPVIRGATDTNPLSRSDRSRRLLRWDTPPRCTAAIVPASWLIAPMADPVSRESVKSGELNTSDRSMTHFART